MTTRLGLPRGIFILITSFVMTVVSFPVYASSKSSCEILLDPIKPVTLKTLRERNTEKLNLFEKEHPMPGFDNIEDEIRNEQVGVVGPRAIQQMLGNAYSFISTPAPSAAMDTAVNVHEEGKSFPVHLDLQWHGIRTSTAVYASLPKTIK